MTAPIDRRAFLSTLSAVMAVPTLRAQSRPAPISIRSFNHVTLAVSDLKRSVDFKPRESQTGPAGSMSPRGGAGRHYISMRMENRGGAKEGTPELYFTDPDGILVQLQDVSYCGGSGVLGNVCPAL